MQMLLYRRAQFAREIGVSEATVKPWLDRRQITFVRLPGGERRIPASELQRILKPVLRGEA